MTDYSQAYNDILTALGLESVPDTVVSLVPSVTESLFDLALGDRLIGRTDYCVYPEGQVERVPTVGGTKNPNIEQIITLNPGLVIANQEENRKQDVEALRAAGIPVWVTFPKTLPDAFNLLWDIMNLFDVTTMVPRVRLLEQTYDYMVALTSAQERLPRVFVPIWLDPLMTFNSDAYAHDLLRVCGAENVFANRERQYPLAADHGQQASQDAGERDVRYPRVTWDEVVEAQPEIILLPDEPYAFTAEHLEQFSRLDVPAAHNQRIHLIDGSYLTWHGTRLAYALQYLPGIIRGDED